ncbi:hypothetical protein ACERK3_09715 [Phycisphaerales bacterium AB-hyl4]|uniref:Uncharacterized protein n=1 Tax=Natronomicrosphaera hydrolytica TaxID=3242702 RepID=A0ABV4U6U4_9BACT
MTKQSPIRPTTVERWHMLARDIEQTAKAIEAGTMTSDDAEERIGRLCSREALALRAKSMTDRRPEYRMVQPRGTGF